MLRAIIIDDELKGVNSLRLLIEKYVDDVKVVAQTTDSLSGLNLIEDYKPEIVFLDIKMPHLDGFELVDRLKFREFDLIFTTAHKEFALKAIKNNALDYLLKPVDIDDLQAALARVRNRILNKQRPPDILRMIQDLSISDPSKIAFPTREKVEYISRNDIIRLESDSNYTTVYTVNGNKLMISRTIGDYEQTLCSSGNFMRVHQSHILNLNHVIRFTKENGGTIFTRDNSQIPLSKNKKEEFVKWLNLR